MSNMGRLEMCREEIKEIRESFFDCNKELFKKVIPDSNPCDIYSVKEILDANEDKITLVKKILCNNKRNGFLVSINSDGVDDRNRVMNTVAHLCQSAGIDLYEIGDLYLGIQKNIRQQLSS